VASVFAELGAAVLDFDRMAHEELEHPAVASELRNWWGERVLSADGAPDRRAIAGIVFEDPAELKRLESLLYPRLQLRREELIRKHEAEPRVSAVVLDAPKLFEAGLERGCDVIVFVEADWATRARRVAAQRGWSEAELRRRENLQIPLDIKKANADHVIANHSGIDALRPEVERVFSSILASFSE
jgi:dephospho-CoA kinase